MKRFSSHIVLSALVHGSLIGIVVFLLGYKPARVFLAGGAGGSGGKSAVVWVSGVTGVGNLGKLNFGDTILNSKNRIKFMSPKLKTQPTPGMKSEGEGKGAGGGTGTGFGTGVGSAAGSGKSDNTVLAEIWRKLDKNKFYPAGAKKKNLEGAPKISFSIDATGKPTNISIVESCGIDILDSAAIETVKRSAPLPTYKPPIVVTLNFSVSDR